MTTGKRNVIAMPSTQPASTAIIEEPFSLESFEGASFRFSLASDGADIRSSEKKDIYSLITERIIEQLETGVVPWHSSVSKQGMSKNLISKKEYRGINPFVLWTAPFDSRYWLTFKQAQGLDGHVKRGEKGFPVVYWHWRSPEEMAKLAAKTPNPAPCYPFYSTVFNIEQCEGIAAPADDTKTFEHSPIEEAERIIAAMPNAPKIEHTHTDRPFYRPSTDMVAVPVARRFETAEDYYSTMFHELAHSTGHESRLNRNASNKHRSFGSPDYSFEELVAEMSAAFLCAHCGIENQLQQSASYIDNWLEVFRKDQKILIEAASAAQRACDYILAKTFDESEPDTAAE